MPSGRFFWQTWFQNKGRDGWDQPQAISDDQTAESYNIELRNGGLGKKRIGSDRVALTFSAGSGLDTSQLAQFIPANNLINAELWILSFVSGTTYALYRVPGNSSSGVLLSAVMTLPTVFAQLNGKFFISYAIAGGVNRVYVYAPNESTTSIRLAGLAPEAAPTVADTGSGTYAATIRTYRVVTRRIVSGVVVSQSEPSASTSFTPSGSGTAARVTKAAASGEGETHWAVQAAASNGLFWEISGNIVVATTTYDDSVDPSNYPNVGLTPDLIGSHLPFPSVRYLLSDGTRLYGLGVHATSAGNSVDPVEGRLYFTPVLDSSDTGDDERIIDTTKSSGWIDLAVGSGGVDRGLGGPINNAIVAFQLRGIYLFFSTGNADIPLRRVVWSTNVGSISGTSVVMGEDESGKPALYFLDPRNGPYRIGQGFYTQWLGKDVKDLWDQVDISSTTPEVSYFGSYDSARKLVIWKCGTLVFVYDVTNGQLVGPNEIRKGWSQWSAIVDAATTGTNTSSVMFSNVLTATHSITQALHYGIASATGPAVLYRVNPSATQDGTASYQAYVRSKDYRWTPIGRLNKLLECVLVAKARDATTVRVLFTSNWGTSQQSQNVSLAPATSETYVRVRPNPVDFTDLPTLQIEAGESTATNQTFELESLELQLEDLEQTR